MLEMRRTPLALNEWGVVAGDASLLKRLLLSVLQDHSCKNSNWCAAQAI